MASTPSYRVGQAEQLVTHWLTHEGAEQLVTQSWTALPLTVNPWSHASVQLPLLAQIGAQLAITSSWVILPVASVVQPVLGGAPVLQPLLVDTLPSTMDIPDCWMGTVFWSSTW